MTQTFLNENYNFFSFQQFLSKNIIKYTNNYYLIYERIIQSTYIIIL